VKSCHKHSKSTLKHFFYLFFKISINIWANPTNKNPPRAVEKIQKLHQHRNANVKIFTDVPVEIVLNVLPEDINGIH